MRLLDPSVSVYKMRGWTCSFTSVLLLGVMFKSKRRTMGSPVLMVLQPWAGLKMFLKTPSCLNILRQNELRSNAKHCYKAIF